MPKQEYIVFYHPHEPLPMTVVDGVAYYRSKGTLSGTPDVWYPFFCVIGNQPLHLEAMPDCCKREQIDAFIKSWPGGTLVKYLERYFDRDHYKRDIIMTGDHAMFREGRICTKKSLMASARLNSPFPKTLLTDAGFTAEELALAAQPIELEDKPVFIFKKMGEINAWLIEHGALFATALIKNEKMTDPQDRFEVKHSQNPKVITDAELDQVWTECRSYQGSAGGMFGVVTHRAEFSEMRQCCKQMYESTDDIKYILALRYIKEHPKTYLAELLNKIIDEKNRLELQPSKPEHKVS